MRHKPISELGIIISLQQVSRDNWDLSVSAPETAKLAKPGQFAHVRVNESFQPFLRRPLSIGPWSGDVLRLIFTVRGEGTRLLTLKHPGDRLDLIAPLGNGFTLPQPGVVPLLVGGGIGVVPLLTLSDALKNSYETALLMGVRSREALPITEFEINQRRMTLSSEDGSIGHRGLVTDLLLSNLECLQGQNVKVYACGPEAMMRAVKAICVERDIPAEASLEVPMGCGIGACMSCAAPRADGRGYVLVCQDGPVFDIRAVDLDPGRAKQ